MSFGYGVGDFLAAATLAWKISIALRGSKDSSENIKSLITELEFTATALNHVGTVLQNSGLQASTKNVVHLGLSRCEAELKKLDEILKKYQEGSEENTPNPTVWINHWLGVKSGFTRCFRNLKWELCEKEGVSELGKSISNNVAMITGILSASGIQTMIEMQDTIKNQVTALNKLETQIPRSLARTWSVDYLPLLLDDALGRKIELPYEICSQSWGTFVKMLQLAFIGMPGSTWVDAGLFSIQSEGVEFQISDQWKSNIKPNMKLTMFMIFLKTVLDRNNVLSLLVECPSCGLEYRGYRRVKEPEKIICARCSNWYSVSEGNSRLRIMGPASEATLTLQIMGPASEATPALQIMRPVSKAPPTLQITELTTEGTSTSRVVEELESNEDVDLEKSCIPDCHEENSAQPEKVSVPLYVHEQDLESFKRVDIRSALEHYKTAASLPHDNSKYSRRSSAYIYQCVGRKRS